MKLITLNIWGGHVREPLLQFIKAHQDVDIFCLQEVYHQAPHKISSEERAVSLNIFAELQALLPQHEAYFKPVVENIYGIGMLIRKECDVLGEGEISIHQNPHYEGRGPTHSRNMQWLTYRHQHKTYSVLNVHGLWNGRGKTDTPERLAQSRRMREFMDTINSPKIICGDFNLRPDTESLRLIEHGMINHVHESRVTSTRSSLYGKEEKFADYIFTSPEVVVKTFAVLPDEVSDHLPLFIEYE